MPLLVASLALSLPLAALADRGLHPAGTPAPGGDAAEDDALTPVDVQTLVAADRDSVWHALSTPEGWKAFTGAVLRVELEPGGQFEVEWVPEAPAGQRGSEGCRVLSLVPGEMLSFSWNAPPKFEFARGQRTWVVMTLQSVKPRLTKVRLRELGFRELAARHPEHREELAAVRAYFAKAWPEVLGMLAGHFARK
jgi:uncharacterized protein YndB with AHSA1/START domain